MQDQAFFCLALNLIPGLGRSKLRSLLDRFESAEAVFRLTPSELARLRLPFQIQSYILSGGALQEAERAADQAKEKGVEILTLFDDSYPQQLKHIYDPPAVLYCRGDRTLLGLPAIAIVGSRRCSVYGRQVTRKLASELGAAGLAIISGMARGIDAEAHRGCLSSQAKTVAVLGNGVEMAYPRENRKLYERILRTGCLISEFPCGVHPAPQNFPIRNRIISGLSLGVLITEAARYSGSLITARLALEQNRELWAVPGNITSAGSFGTNSLIKQGAGAILCSQDLVDELPSYVQSGLRLDDQAPPERAEGADEGRDGPRQPSEDEKKVLELLKPDEAIGFDQLASLSGLDAARLNRLLFQLEMRGWVIQDRGRTYSRKLR